MALPVRKLFSAMLAYSCNVQFSQNLPDQTEFYWTCPSVLLILESLLFVIWQTLTIHVSLENVDKAYRKLFSAANPNSLS